MAHLYARSTALRRLDEADKGKIWLLRQQGIETENLAARFGVSRDAISKALAEHKRTLATA